MTDVSFLQFRKWRQKGWEYYEVLYMFTLQKYNN